MKTVVALLCLLLMALPAAAAETDRLAEAAEVLREMAGAPDAEIPQELWEGANCVAVIPDVKKAGFIFGGEYGRGVLSCRTRAGWSAPAFVRLAKGSWGAQIGAQEIDLVLLFMSDEGLESLLNNEVTLGADASVAAGPVGRAGRAETDLALNAQILSYSRAQGLFAGIDLSGGTLGPDDDAIEDIYGPSVTVREIIDGSLEPPDAAAEFMAALSGEARPVGTAGEPRR